MTKTDRVHAAGVEAYERGDVDIFWAVFTALKTEGVKPVFAAGTAREYAFMITRGYWYKSGPIPAREILATWFNE